MTRPLWFAEIYLFFFASIQTEADFSAFFLTNEYNNGFRSTGVTLNFYVLTLTSMRNYILHFPLSRFGYLKSCKYSS
jgi:hypothetical protein